MRQILSRSIVPLVAVFLLACTDQHPPTAPLQPADEAATLHPMAAAAFGANRAMVETSEVFTFVPEEPVAGAVAQLVRTGSGIAYSLRTNGLMNGHAYSIWWVIFNNPEACDGDCGIEDLFVDFPTDLTPNPEVNPAVMSGGGNVVGQSGRAGFAGHLNEGQITNEHPLFIGGPGLLDARGAEIHLVVRSHGPMIPGMVRLQISTFEGGCETVGGHPIIPLWGHPVLRTSH
jgi:hypothetical protein